MVVLTAEERVAERPVVLHVVEAMATGTLRHVTDLIRWTSEVDHAVAGPSRHDGASTAVARAALEAAGARYELVEMGRFRAPHRHLRALRALQSTIARVRPDIVHGHSSIGGAMARLAATGTGIPVVYTPHGLTRSSWALVAERVLRDRADRVIAVSQGEREFAIRRGAARQDQAVVILNGVEPTPPPRLPASLRASLGIPIDAPLVGSVGRLTWQKAPEVFVAACERVSAELTDAHFVLIGTGALHAVVRSAVRDAGLDDRFHLVPSLPEASAALAELDVFALSSRFEGAAYTLLEALRAGTPVVVTDVAGNRDLVQDGENGLLVAPDSPEQLAEALVQILQDPSLGARLAREAVNTVTRCDVRAMAAATAAVYRGLCGQGSLNERLPHATSRRARLRSSATRTV